MTRLQHVGVMVVDDEARVRAVARAVLEGAQILEKPFSPARLLETVWAALSPDHEAATDIARSF